MQILFNVDMTRFSGVNFLWHFFFTEDTLTGTSFIFKLFIMRSRQEMFKHRLCPKLDLGLVGLFT